MSPPLPPPVRVLAKPERRYVHRAYWAAPASGRCCSKTIAVFGALFSRDFLARLCAEAPLPVVGLSGRRGGEYELFVIAANAVYMQREGELAIVVAGRPTGRELCRLSLCFARVDGEPAIVVGGLQGPASIFKRDVVDATRDLSASARRTRRCSPPARWDGRLASTSCTRSQTPITCCDDCRTRRNSRATMPIGWSAGGSLAARSASSSARSKRLRRPAIVATRRKRQSSRGWKRSSPPIGRRGNRWTVTSARSRQIFAISRATSIACNAAVVRLGAEQDSLAGVVKTTASRPLTRGADEDESGGTSENQGGSRRSHFVSTAIITTSPSAAERRSLLSPIIA